MDREFWRGRRVLVTGHTGFKGGWLAVWLLDMGAIVTGLALPPSTTPSLFALCGLERRLGSTMGDIRDYEDVREIFARRRPEIVFHLAAQPLVRRSYREPLETFGTNVMGTAHVLEAARHTPSVRAVVVVTSDKCYENREMLWDYRESDPLGGRDPYSASKGCAELVTAAYGGSFFSELPGALATVRAGNVIGGGDWSEDRLIPDTIRALRRGTALALRNPGSVRPWQHVLEPLAGYLALAERLHEQGTIWSGAWNFGPRDEDAREARVVADLVIRHWGSGSWRQVESPDAPHESRQLRLDCSKARALLGWRPILTLEEAISLTVDWYRGAECEDADAFALTRTQIREFERRAPFFAREQVA